MSTMRICKEFNVSGMRNSAFVSWHILKMLLIIMAATICQHPQNDVVNPDEFVLTGSSVWVWRGG